jgi:adenosylmethionine-8-amino-7-oxononanoate aminotransferase
MIKEDILGRVQELEPCFADMMSYYLTENHPFIKQYRHIGMLGCLDVHDINGNNPQLQHQPPNPVSLYCVPKGVC